MIIWRWTSPLDGLNTYVSTYGVGAGGLYDGSGFGAADEQTWYLDSEDHVTCDPFDKERSYDFF